MTLTLDIIIPTLALAGTESMDSIRATCAQRIHPLLIGGDDGPLEKMQKGYKEVDDRDTDVLAFFHDDVEVYKQGWDTRVLAEFERDPRVAVVGFLGALGLGRDDIYKRPYEMAQLARFDVLSNMRNAEEHGRRFTGECDVATLDGFALIVRRAFLDQFGGWPLRDQLPPHHSYDNVLCLAAWKTGWKVRLVGVDCYHHGGLTSTAPQYQDWCKTTKWGSDAEMHRVSHFPLYEYGRGILPLRLPKP